MQVYKKPPTVFDRGGPVCYPTACQDAPRPGPPRRWSDRSGQSICSLRHLLMGEYSIIRSR